MAHNANHSPKIPEAMIERHRQGWNAFTYATKLGCISLAVLLVMMLVFLRIL